MTLLAFVVACGGGQKKPSDNPILPPEPGTKAPEPEAAAKPPAEPAKPAAPLPPADVNLPLGDSTVKLLKPGAGKKAKLAFAPKADAKQTVEIAMDFHAKQDAQEDVSPTVVIVGDATAKADQTTFTVTGTSAREVSGSKLPITQLEQALGSLHGMTIASTVTPSGTSKELVLHIDKPDQMTNSALQLVGLAWPEWIGVPNEPIGVGAKWEVTTKTHFAEKLEITRITTYELKAHAGATWTIEETSKTTGPDQDLEGAKATGISGAGTGTITLTDGAVLPTAMTGKNETHFSVDAGGKMLVLSMETGVVIKAK